MPNLPWDDINVHGLIQFDEFCNQLQEMYEGEALLDVLGISEEEIIERFKDKVFVHYQEER